MILCMDTAYKFLSLTLIDDNQVIASYNEECFKKQSERIFVEIDKLFKENNLTAQDLDGVCITKGPGSYTGVRIAMTVAKILATQLDIDLYTISTLRLYANNQPNTAVIMDARSSRVYFGVYNGSEEIVADTIINNEQIKDYAKYHLIGDLYLIGQDNINYNISECFLNTQSQWVKEQNKHLVAPVYLKDYA